MKFSSETIGTLMVAIGLVVGLYAHFYHWSVDYGSKFERDTWYGDASAYIAAILVILGLILAIFGKK